jgi:hypothetical protein
MVTLRQVIEALNLEALTPQEKDRSIQGGYASDLLSCVMAGARQHYVWVTLQAHMNVVAVASLLGLSAVIITEGKRPEPEVIDRAREEGVLLLLSEQSTFSVVGRLFSLGIFGEMARGI